MLLVSSLFYFFVYPSIVTDQNESEELLTYETGLLFSNTKGSRYVLRYNVEFRTKDDYTFDFLTNREGKVINTTIEEIRKIPYDIIKKPNGVERIRNILSSKYKEIDSDLEIDEIYFKEFVLDKMAI